MEFQKELSVRNAIFNPEFPCTEVGLHSRVRRHVGPPTAGHITGQILNNVFFTRGWNDSQRRASLSSSEGWKIRRSIRLPAFFAGRSWRPFRPENTLSHFLALKAFVTSTGSGSEMRPRISTPPVSFRSPMQIVLVDAKMEDLITRMVGFEPTGKSFAKPVHAISIQLDCGHPGPGPGRNVLPT